MRLRQRRADLPIRVVRQREVGHDEVVPLVDVFFDPRVDANQLRRIADVLLKAVPCAVECVEEPILGPLAVGDLEIRFTPRGSDQNRRSGLPVSEVP